jgi:hypothetical protein
MTSNGKAESAAAKKKKAAASAASTSAAEQDKTTVTPVTEKKKEKKEKKEKKGRGGKAAKKKDEKEVTPSSNAASSSSSGDHTAASSSSAAVTQTSEASIKTGGSEAKQADGEKAKAKSKAKPKSKQAQTKDAADDYNAIFSKCGANAVKNMVANCFAQKIKIASLKPEQPKPETETDKDEKDKKVREKARMEASAISHIRHFFIQITEELVYGAAFCAVDMNSTNIRSPHVCEGACSIMPGSELLEAYTSRFPVRNEKVQKFVAERMANPMRSLTRKPQHRYASPI